MITKIQPRFADYDMFGHLNNGAYLAYADLGKVEFFSRVLDEPFEPAKTGIVIAHIELDFLMQTLPSQTVEVHTRCTHVGTSSISIEQQIVDEKGRAHAKISSVMVQLDTTTGASKPISDTMRNRLLSDDL